MTAALLALALFAVPATPAESAAGKKLLDQAIAAAGGATAIAAVKDVTSTGSLTATLAGADVDGSVTMIETSDGSTRDEMSMGGFEIVSAAGPAGAYESQAGIPKTPQGAELADAKAQSRFTPLGLLIHGGDPDVVLRGLPPRGGFDVLEVDPPGASPLTFLLDAKTHLVAKIDVTSPEGTLETRYAAWRPEAGVQMPHQIAVTQAGFAMTFTLTNVAVNTGVTLNTLTGTVNTATAPAIPSSTSSGAAAEAPPGANVTLSLTNATGKTLGEFHLSPHQKKNWGDNLLPVDKFHDGDTATLHFAPKDECVFDMMTTDLDGHYFVVPGVNLCTHRLITLHARKKGLDFEAR